MSLITGVRMRGAAPKSPSLDREKITSLRTLTKQEKKTPFWMCFRKQAAEIFCSLTTELLPQSDRGRSTRMCANYGHEIKGQPFSRVGVFCRDCGQQVTQLDQLRRAVAK